MLPRSKLKLLLHQVLEQRENPACTGACVACFVIPEAVQSCLSGLRASVACFVVLQREDLTSRGLLELLLSGDAGVSLPELRPFWPLLPWCSALSLSASCSRPALPHATNICTARTKQVHAQPQHYQPLLCRKACLVLTTGFTMLVNAVARSSPGTLRFQRIFGHAFMTTWW